MNFFKYTDIDGKQKVGSFCSDWDEVRFTDFLKWDSILQEMELVKKELQHIEQQATEMQVRAEEIKQHLNKDAYEKEYGIEPEILAETEKAALKSKSLLERYKTIKETKLIPLELQAISLFTDVSPAALALLPKGKEIDLSSVNIDWVQGDGNIQYLKVLLYLLANKPLPTKTISKFYWQTKTDAEIEKMENELKKIRFTEKLFGKGKRLRKELDAAVKGVFEVKNIWEHSTYANSQFQKSAKAIVADMQEGRWENAPALISMLLVETSANEQVLQEMQQLNPTGTNNAPKEYLERYAQAYKKVFDKNQELFFGQKNKLTVAHIIGIRNFFLTNPHK